MARTSAAFRGSSAQAPTERNQAAQSQPQEAQQLELEKPVERELAGGQSHSYQVTLGVGQYMNVVVDQRGIDVVVALFAIDGKKLREVDSPNGSQGPESVDWIAEIAGGYQLEVRSREKAAKPGRYEVRLSELRPATASDRTRLEEALVLAEARLLESEQIRLVNAGQYDQALPLAERALMIREKALGAEHPDTARSLNELGVIYRRKGDYAKAEPLYQRALAIREKILGEEHRATALSINNLALLHMSKGDYVKAEPLYQRALAIREKTLGAEHPDTANSLNTLANLYELKGDYAKAEPLAQRALAIREKVLGAEHPETANTLQVLAVIYGSKKDFAKAETHYHRALTIRKKIFGEEHPSIAPTLLGLAFLYSSNGDYDKAEPLNQRALAICEKIFGAEHPDTAGALNNLAVLYDNKGDYARAEPLHKRALAIQEKMLGAEHPQYTSSLYNLATLYAAIGDLVQAVKLYSRACAITERSIALNLATGSERQKLAYLATLSGQLDVAISLHVQYAPNNPAASVLAPTTIMQRKGRALDATSDSIGALRRYLNPQDQILLDQWKDTNAQMARLILGGPQRTTPVEHQKQIKELEEQKERLEGDISRHSAEFRAQSHSMTLDAIRSVIPADTALIEFAAYRPFNAKYAKTNKQFGQPRYVAYVLHQQGNPGWVDLGEAKAIDDAVGALRQALRDQRRTDVKRVARAVDEKLMRPVRALLGDARHVLLSPDSTLNLVPFAALVDEQGRYLIERYEFSYLTSGRDLLRLQVPIPFKQEPVIVAGPAFGERDAVRTETRDFAHETGSVTTHAFNRFSFRPLPGAAAEGIALQSLLPGATFLTGERATKAALKQLNSPKILHIATHGFFLEDLKVVASGSQAVNIDNPLLRSGLALAGANKRTEEEEGILTALEVANLDLWGTKLVALSACDTGVGEVKNGDGVYGLRRALTLAGAESSLMSLWPVSDRGTRDLMVAYYKGLQRGEGRGEALRQVQLRMLRQKMRSHPYYWASFIQSGEWANLAGERQPAGVRVK